jgi:transcriptional regulator with XRE-family HTH domain
MGLKDITMILYNILGGDIMKLGDKIKFYRKNNNFTQNDLSSYLHVSSKTISGWENNRSTPDINTLFIISKVFNVSMDNFLDDKVIDHYDNLSKFFSKNIARTKIIFVLVIFFLFASYINMYGIDGIHFFIIPIFLLLSEILFIFNYVYKLKHPFKVFCFYLLFMTLNFCLIFSNPYFIMDVANKEASYIIGSTIGEFMLNIILSFGLTILFFLNPFKKNNDFKIK